MTQPVIQVYADLEELSRAAATDFVELAGATISQKQGFSVALSGGSTPRRLYELLASTYSKQVEWAKIQLFQVDERAVPPDHAFSNYRMIRESLLVPAAVPEQNFHRMAGEMEPTVAAAGYARDLELYISDRQKELPRFDLILLGMGPDGHVASLFPGSELLEEDVRWTAVGGPGPEGLRRITLTFPVLNAAARIVFLVSGVGKAETLARVLKPVKSYDMLPVEYVIRKNNSMTWYLDRAAASRMQIG